MKTYRIEDDTPILPHIIADNVIEEVMRYLNETIPEARDIADSLAERANTIYASNASWRKKIRAKGNKGRDTLYVFMHHWFASELKQRYPALYKRMPPGWGWDLPLPLPKR